MLEFLLLNDDWPIPRKEKDADDLLTCEARLDVRRPDGWGARADFRVLTDKWNAPKYCRTDEAEAVIVSPWGVEFGGVVSGNLGGKGAQDWWHDLTGETHVAGRYEPTTEARPLLCYRNAGDLWWADARWWGDGYRLAAGPRITWAGRGLELTARAGVAVFGGDQLSAAAASWQENGEPFCAELRANYSGALFVLEWSQGQVRGGIGCRF